MCLFPRTFDRGRSIAIGEFGVSSCATCSSFSVDIVLLHDVLAGRCRIVKSIPKANRLGFSRFLKVSLGKVVASPQDLASWALLLLLSSCTLRVTRSRTNYKSGMKGCYQVEGILRALLGS